MARPQIPSRTKIHGVSVIDTSIRPAALDAGAETRVTVVGYNLKDATGGLAHTVTAFRAPASGATVQKVMWGPGAALSSPTRANAFTVSVHNVSRNITLHTKTIGLSSGVWTATGVANITVTRNGAMLANECLQVNIGVSGAPAAAYPIAIVEWIPR